MTDTSKLADLFKQAEEVMREMQTDAISALAEINEVLVVLGDDDAEDLIVSLGTARYHIQSIIEATEGT